MSTDFTYDKLLDKLDTISHWSEHNESLLLEPYRYCTSQPGKEIRPKLIEAFNFWLHVPEKELKTISRIVALLHNASLLIDDIEDGSQLRRGRPVAHKIYGIPQTINTANYVYFQSFQELATLQRGPLISETVHPWCKGSLETIVNSELMSLHRGQGLELFWRDTLTCPTEQEYIGMVNNKTGGLFRIAIKLMMACATTNLEVDYLPLVNLIGVFFQIRDDYMNLQADEYNVNKGFAEDLTEGKFSFPVIHGIHANTEDRQILNVLQKRPGTPTLKKHVISYLEEETKSLEYTRTVVNTLEIQLREEVARLGGNKAIEAIVDALSLRSEK